MSDRPSLLFVSQHYAPDLASTAQHLTDLAEHLAAEGFEVHVLCSRGHYLSGEMDGPAAPPFAAGGSATGSTGRERPTRPTPARP